MRSAASDQDSSIELDSDENLEPALDRELPERRSPL
jgi:hypothetical protein